MIFSAHGIYTAFLSPRLRKSGHSFLTSWPFRKLIDFQIESGISGLLVVGGAGEYVSLTPSERKQVVEVAVEHVKGRVPVIVGAASNA